MPDDAKSFRRRPRPAEEPTDPASLIGRSPPHSIEAEDYLLSCCLLDGNDVVARCLEGKLSAAAFYSSANRIVYEKLVELYNSGTAIDLAVLAEELKT